MQLVVTTYRPAGQPGLIEALTSDGTYAALLDSTPTLEAHLRVADELMSKLGYTRKDYAVADSASITDRHWRFKFTVPDVFPLRREWP